MSTTFPSLRELAAQLLAASAHTPISEGLKTVLVNENFRVALARLTGAAGVASLLQRALALASTEISLLHGVKLNSKGQLEGLDHLFGEGGTSREIAEMAVTVQMLELLVTFIGEGITRRLVREAVSANGTGR